MTEPGNFADLSLRGTWSYNVPMSKHTSWRAGGVAERMYQPADKEDLLAFLRSLPADEPLYAVGLGSNLLVRDGGLRGTVLMLHGTLSALRIEPEGSISHEGGSHGCAANDDKSTQSVTSQWLGGKDTLAPTTLYVEAGVPGAKLARFAAAHNLYGAEFFAGIPGTVGGMLAMNAGCYGSEIWEKVQRVLVVDRSGVLRERTPLDYEIGYRHVALHPSPQSSGGTTSHSTKPSENDGQVAGYPASGRGGEREGHSSTPAAEEWFVAAWLKFEAGYSDIARQEIKALLNKRIASQPLNLPNAGSVFRNPLGDYAARLIEQCGLKGRSIGGAQVSEKHANFIVNTGGATASDIENLINEVRVTVEQQTGVRLKCEVRIIGEAKG